jgi:hypothetical protein
MRAGLTAAFALAAMLGIWAALSRLFYSLGMQWWSVSVIAAVSAMAAIAFAWPAARVAGAGAMSKVASACYLSVGLIAPATFVAGVVTGVPAPGWVNPLLLAITFCSAGLYMRGTDASTRESAAAQAPRIRRATPE